MKRGGRDRGRIQVALVALVGLAVLAGLAFWLLRARRAFDLEAAQRAARGRDVVLLTLDTTRIDRLGCYGYSRATSPAINRLAAEGWRFETAYASAPVTLPSHTSILTGMYPMAHGVRNNARYRLRDDVKTLAESLRDGGYQTAAFLSALVLESRHGLNQGFDFYGDDVAGHDAENRFAIGQRPAPAVVDEALAWFRDRDPNRPAFVWLHFFDPHHPLTPPADLVEQFGTSDDDLYDAEIRVMDDAIARLRAELDDLGVDPIWAIVSDHGEGLGDHREPGHGSFVYDTTMRAALVLKASGVFRPRVPDRVARQIDVMPTLLDLLDLPIPDDLDGVSLLRPVDESAPDEAYLEAMLGYEDYGWSPVYGLVRLPWKYVEAPRPELYNIEEDPGELRNLVDREAELASEMRDDLADYLARGAGVADAISVDAEQQEALRSLGYLGEGSVALEGEELPDPKDMVDVWQQLNMARGYIVEGPGRDPMRGFRILEDVLRKNPANGEAMRMLGREALSEAQRVRSGADRDTYLDLSRSAFERYRERVPTHPEGPYGLAMIAFEEGDRDASVALFEQALELDPEYMDALGNLMRLRDIRQEWREAADVAARILALDADHRDALRIGALAHYRLGEYERAVDRFSAMLPTTDAAQRNSASFYLGDSLRRLGQHERALEYFAKVEEPLRTTKRVAALEAECRRALE